MGAWLIWGAILIGTIVAAERFGFDAHAVESRYRANFMHNKPMGKFGAMSNARLDPVFVLYIPDQKYRHDRHLGVQKHIGIFEIATVICNVDCLMRR